MITVSSEAVGMDSFEEGLEKLEVVLRSVLRGIPDCIVTGEDINTFQMFPDQAGDFVVEVVYLPDETAAGPFADSARRLEVAYRRVGETPVQAASARIDLAESGSAKEMLSRSPDVIDLAEFGLVVFADIKDRRPDMLV